jgi:NAD(P)-dependent dehydrogenase (short-subunit alcohol dehydrogenase family)
MKIKNKIIVITGGTKGLGLSLSKILSLNENSVIVASRLPSKKNTNKNVLLVKTDITREVEVRKLASFVVKKFNRIDIWINNAGIWLPHSPIEKVDIKRVRSLMDVNFFGTFYGSKHALMQMRKQKKGVIVNILSSSALDGGIGSSGYCASKFAASGFTKCLRYETANNGIKVISVYSRGMKTDFFNEKKPYEYNKFMEPNFVAKKIISNLELKNPKQDLLINY